MPVSIDLLRRMASETGFDAAILEKVTRLGEVAADAARHPLLKDVLLLKGGTALNLCWGVPQRLSVDLDYNYVGELERSEMIRARPKVEASMDELARRQGYTVQASAPAHAGGKRYLQYRSAFGGPDRIEIDLNFVYRLPVGESETRELWQPGELDRPSIRMVSLAELCIGKLLALLDRVAPRDAWDVARLPEIAPDLLTSAMFRAQFLVLASTLTHPVHTYTRERLTKRLGDPAVREQLLPVLVGGARVTAADLVDEAWAVVEPLLRLTPQEAEFVAGVGRGELRLELLGHPAADELAGHPAVLWKLENVTQHLNRTEAEGRSTGDGNRRA